MGRTCFAFTCARWPRRASTRVSGVVVAGRGSTWSSWQCAAGGTMLGRCAHPVAAPATILASLISPCPRPPPPSLPRHAAACTEVVDVSAVHAALRADRPEVLAALEGSAAAPPAAEEAVPACVASGRRDEWEVGLWEGPASGERDLEPRGVAAPACLLVAQACCIASLTQRVPLTHRVPSPLPARRSHSWAPGRRCPASTAT